MSTSITPYSPQTRAAAPSTRSAVFSSMPKPRRTPASAMATTSRPSRPRLMKCWSTMPKGKKPRPLPSSRPGRLRVVGDAVHHRLDRGAAEDHRLRHHRRAGARAGDQPAGGLGGADRGEQRRLGAARRQRADDLGLVAAGEVDAAEGGDPGDERPGRGRGARAFAGGERHHLGLEAVGAEDLRRSRAPTAFGLGGGGGEDQDAAAGEPVHLGEDRDVVVLQPAADDGEAASRPALTV